MSFLDNVKAIPITDYAARIGFTVVRKGARYCSLREHDSLMIDTQKNAYWHNSVFRRGMRGGAGSVIDFAMEFSGYATVNEALRGLAVMYGIEGEQTAKVQYKRPEAAQADARPKREVGNLDLPEKADKNNAVYRYLYHERKIEQSVIRYFFAKGMLYQDVRSNCVFVSNRFGCIRSTGGKRFVIDVAGCDYDECFYFKPSQAADTIIVAESVIDIMSIMSVFVREKKKYTQYAYLALSGTNKLPSLFYHLDKDPGITKVMLALDNDEAGSKALMAAEEELIERGMNGRFTVFSAPEGKDWNDYLKMTSSW